MSRNSGGDNNISDQELNSSMQQIQIQLGAARQQYSVETVSSSDSNNNSNNNVHMVSDRGQMVEAQMLHPGNAAVTAAVPTAMAVPVARSLQQQQQQQSVGGIRTGTPSSSPSQSPASSMQVSPRVTSSSSTPTATAAAAASSSSSTRTATPCAACKLLRRKCVPECPFSPYFHPTEPHKFACVHKIFGASNVSKMLLEVPESQRADVANSLVFEANARIRDPVYGCLGAISALQQEAQALQAELHAIRTQIMNFKFQERAMAAAASATHHPQQQQHYNQQIQMNNNFNSNQLGHASLHKPSHFASPTSFNSHLNVHNNNNSSNNNNDHFNIHSPSSHTPMQASSVNMDLKEQHYWSQLHQSC